MGLQKFRIFLKSSCPSRRKPRDFLYHITLPRFSLANEEFRADGPPHIFRARRVCSATGCSGSRTPKPLLKKSQGNRMLNYPCQTEKLFKMGRLTSSPALFPDSPGQGCSLRAPALSSPVNGCPKRCGIHHLPSEVTQYSAAGNSTQPFSPRCFCHCTRWHPANTALTLPHHGLLTLATPRAAGAPLIPPPSCSLPSTPDTGTTDRRQRASSPRLSTGVLPPGTEEQLPLAPARCVQTSRHAPGSPGSSWAQL